MVKGSFPWSRRTVLPTTVQIRISHFLLGSCRTARSVTPSIVFVPSIVSISLIASANSQQFLTLQFDFSKGNSFEPIILIINLINDVTFFYVFYTDLRTQVLLPFIFHS